VRFDGGALTIADDLTIVDVAGATVAKLRTLSSHTLDAACLAYHLEHRAGG
jgi:hypothetical protein